MNLRADLWVLKERRTLVWRKDLRTNLVLKERIEGYLYGLRNYKGSKDAFQVSKGRNLRQICGYRKEFEGYQII